MTNDSISETDLSLYASTFRIIVYKEPQDMKCTLKKASTCVTYCRYYVLSAEIAMYDRPRSFLALQRWLAMYSIQGYQSFLAFYFC